MELLFLLLPLAALSGWWLGRREAPGPEGEATAGDGRRAEGYLKGFNYILDERPDKALELFLELVAVDSETVETHLALASLYRRRGEVDRAIRIHQNLIARPNLTPTQRSRSLLELANDYMGAGLLDRAEGLYKELLPLGAHEPEALRKLLELYQRERSWQEMIDTARRYERVARKDMGRVIAHCHCELSEAAIAGGDLKEAAQQAREGLASDRNCVRAGMLLGDIAMREEDFQGALATFRQVEQQDADFLAETLDRQAACCARLGRREEHLDYLRGVFDRHPHGGVLLHLVRELRAVEGDESARRFLLEHLDECASLAASHFLLALGLRSEDDCDRQVVGRILGQLERFLRDQPVYQCRQCGLATRMLYWQCPGCKSWATVKPRRTAEAD